MEVDPEITIFARKAARYLAALRAVPSARVLEVVPLLATVEELGTRLDPPVYVADAMAGSGYLARYLCKLGHRVIAYEGCKEMMAGEGQAPYRFVRIERAEDLPQMLREQGVQIAVTLASFHHLVWTDEGGAVSPGRSVERQTDLVAASFDKAPELAYFVIADVTATELVSPVVAAWPWANGKSAAWRGIAEDAAPGEVLANSDGADGYASTLERLYGPSSAHPARWFREVVHPHSITGHHDCFLGESFVSRLAERGFRVQARIFSSPWSFPDMQALHRFLWDKFAFAEGDAFFGMDDAARIAEQLLGLRLLPSGAVLLGWSLGHVIVSRGDVSR